jgi:hypothetical protein
VKIGYSTTYWNIVVVTDGGMMLLPPDFVLLRHELAFHGGERLHKSATAAQRGGGKSSCGSFFEIFSNVGAGMTAITE